MTFPTYQHRFRASTLIASDRYSNNRRDCLGVDAKLHYIEGNMLPYFSVTGWIGQNEDRAHTAGMLHEEILKAWPKLRSVVTLHLCDADGVPMHAEANGWYYLAGYYQTTGDAYTFATSQSLMADGFRMPTADECLDVFAAHVRIPLATALSLADYWMASTPTWENCRRMFAQWLALQSPRFAEDAAKAILVLDTLIAEQGSR